MNKLIKKKKIMRVFPLHPLHLQLEVWESGEVITTKFVYHGTKIEYSSSILSDNFLVGKDCWYGLGIYFT